MTTVLVTGPGGAGTSTVSAALAVRAARQGRSAVLVSRRPVAGLDGTDGLRVVAVDAQRAFEDLWGGAAPALSAALPDLAVPPGSSVVAPPGAGEVALLAEVGRAAAAGADLVVVDAGPLDAGLALLALPGALRWWLGQVLPTRLRMLGAVRTAAVRTGAVRPGPVDAVLAAVPAVERLLASVDLADPARTEVHLAVAAREAAVTAVRAALPVLALHGQRPVTVHARVLPEAGAGEWWAARSAEQTRALGGLTELATVARVPERASCPAGADELAALLAAGDPAPATAPPALPEPVRVPGGWRLTLPLPHARRDSLELTRWEDDLVVTLDGARRSLRLDALLRRCTVTGGSLADAGTAAARLEIDFAPDPQQWPADLLAAEGSTA